MTLNWFFQEIPLLPPTLPQEHTEDEQERAGKVSSNSHVNVRRREERSSPTVTAVQTTSCLSALLPSSVVKQEEEEEEEESQEEEEVTQVITLSPEQYAALTGQLLVK